MENSPKTETNIQLLTVGSRFFFFLTGTKADDPIQGTKTNKTGEYNDDGNNHQGNAYPTC